METVKNGKGSVRRPTDENKFRENYDKIFRKKNIDKSENSDNIKK